MSFLKKLFQAAAQEERLPIEVLIGETIPCFTDPKNRVSVPTLVQSIEVCGYQDLLLVNAETSPVYVPTLLATSRMYGEPDPTEDMLKAFEEIANAFAMESKLETKAKNTPNWMKKNRIKKFNRAKRREN